MSLHGINAVFRENKDGRVFGLTLIDNKHGYVFNGSDLGKEYSGQRLIKMLEDNKTSEEQKIESVRTIYSENSYEQKSGWNKEIPYVILDLLKTQKFYTEADQPFKKKRKKRKARL